MADTIDWKARYEGSEKRLKELRELSHKAVGDYDELQRKYDQNQKQYEELKQRLLSTEAQVLKMQSALEPVYEEYKDMNEKYELEKECRTEAERYASKIAKQNKKLKRQSQVIFEKVKLSIADIAEISSNEDTIEEPDERDRLNLLIQNLQAEAQDLQNAIEKVTLERDDALSREQQSRQRATALEAEVNTLTERCAELDRALNNLRKASTMVYQEAKDIQANYQQEKELKKVAEGYAHRMSVARDCMARQSAALMETAMSDARLRDALMRNEELMKDLEDQKYKHKEQLAEIENNAEDSSQSAAIIADLESQLSIAEDEVERMKAKMKAMDDWKSKLERENRDLVDKLDVAEQKLRPPPPPPLPPPPTIFKPLQFLKKKKPAAAKLLGTNSNQDPKYEKALEEMMKRIKSGAALKPVMERKLSLPTSNTAISELQNILGSLKRSTSVDAGSSRYQAVVNNNVENSVSELARKFQHHVQTQNDPQNLSRISEGDEPDIHSPTMRSNEMAFGRMDSSQI